MSRPRQAFLALSMSCVVLASSGCAHPGRRAASASELTGEARFFQRCAMGRRIRIHRDRTPYDLHAVLYTTANLMELEVIRLADWLIDLPLPGAELRPLERAVYGARAAYHRLGHSRPVVRVGEFVDALQLRELSLGDAAATYTVATGGTVSPGSGTIVRVQKLLDWTQHVVGDVNALLGWPVGRGQGLVRWRLPGSIVDGMQHALARTVHAVSVTVARILDRSITGLEGGLELALNAPRPSNHRETTVFLRMPLDVHRTHDLWVHRHRRRVYVGTEEEVRGLSHGELFHPRRPRRRPRWWELERLSPVPSRVVIVTDLRAFADAPKELQPYVVPAAWIMDSPSD